MPNVVAIFRRGTPNGGVKCRPCGVGTNRDSGRISGYRSMTAAVRGQQLTVVGAVVYHSYSARLFTARRPSRISEYTKEKRTEQNYCILWSTKSKVEVRLIIDFTRRIVQVNYWSIVKQCTASLRQQGYLYMYCCSVLFTVFPLTS